MLKNFILNLYYDIIGYKDIVYMDFKQKLNELPDKSGVYLMMDAEGTIIYVGKARSLKKRVHQYFNAGNKTEKTLALVRNIADFRYIIATSEVDALVLENNLIKQYNPKYNILLKDDKSYPFIRIDLKSKFPTLEITRKLKNDGARYFGPYMQGISIKDTVELIFSTFPLRNCLLDLDRLPPSHRPCLNAHINRCLAPCAGGVSPEEYRNIVCGVIDFLKGNDKEVKNILEEKMHAASLKSDFEMAIFYRDKLKMLDKLIRQQISALPKDFNLDVFSAVDNGIMTVVTVIIVRGGKILGGDNFPLTTGLTAADMPRLVNRENTVEISESESDLKREEMKSNLTQFVLQYYQQTPSFPDEIVVNETLSDENALETVLSELSGRKLNIVKPVQGIRKQLTNMAENNALDYLNNFITKSLKKDSVTRGAVVKLAEILNLKTLPERIECYDISHISGTNMVASMVVFSGGEPVSSQYRRFKIKTVSGNNDFACMQEVLLRRLTRLAERDPDSSFGSVPDLIVVDGGKGQLGYALEALKATNTEDISIISLAKREEEVYLPYRPEPVIIDKNSVALQLLQRVRDEAHRFAISYHKQLRTNNQTVSELSKIDGIGSKKINLLYSHFKSLPKIKAASIDELIEVKGISARDAKAVTEYFRAKN